MSRIYDPSALEVPADFTLSMDIPEGGYDTLNPDGTVPQVSMKVEASPSVSLSLFFRS